MANVPDYLRDVHQQFKFLVDFLKASYNSLRKDKIHRSHIFQSLLVGNIFFQFTQDQPKPAVEHPRPRRSQQKCAKLSASDENKHIALPSTSGQTDNRGVRRSLRILKLAPNVHGTDPEVTWSKMTCLVAEDCCFYQKCHFH